MNACITSSGPEQIRSRNLHVVTRECAVDAILHSRAQPHQKNAKAKQWISSKSKKLTTANR